MDLDFTAYNEDAVIIGQKGSGKSFLANELMRGLRSINVIVYDFNFQFHDSRAVVLNTVEDTFRIYDKLNVNGTHIILQPFDKSQNTFNRFCSEIFSRNNICCIIDESHQYMSKQSIPKPYNDLILSGRPRGISTISISSRPQNLPSNTLTNAAHIFAFKLALPSDVDYLEDWLGSKAWVLLSPDVRKKHQQEPEIEQHSFLYRNTNRSEGEICKI